MNTFKASPVLCPYCGGHHVVANRSHGPHQLGVTRQFVEEEMLCYSCNALWYNIYSFIKQESKQGELLKEI